MTTRIKILGEAPAPITAEPMPLDRSLRWNSPHENRIGGHVEIFLAQSAYCKCVEHASSDLEHEVGGALIGEVRLDPVQARPYILVQKILPALHTESGQTHVTFTQDTLVYLNQELEHRSPGKRIVGWYHTHPGFGVFMSSYDRWLHENFFNDPTQVALVIDPYYEQGGFFCRQSDLGLDPVHYVGFYELSDMNDDSVVEWNNLMPAVEGAQLNCARTIH